MNTPDQPGPSADEQDRVRTGDMLWPVTGQMVQQLRNTRPWVRFMSICGFIGCGLMLVLGALMIAFGLTNSELAVQGLFLGPLYLLVTPLYFFLSLHLLRYARSIRQLEAGGGALSMEEALGHQKAFWRLVGIISAVTMSIYGLILLIGLVALVIIAALR